MAKIKQGILGGFSGKVANVVGTSWKGRAVMKSQPLSVSNPKTEAQVGQRNKFSKVAELASQILTQFVQPVENPISGDISGYNLFCRDNKTAFDAVGDLVPANLVAGGGKIVNLQQAQCNPAEGDSSITLTWTNSADLSALRKTDKVYAFVVDADANVLAVADGSTTRNAQSVNMQLLAGAEMPESMSYIYVVYACVSADGREVSVKTAAADFQVGD